MWGCQINTKIDLFGDEASVCWKHMVLHTMKSPKPRAKYGAEDILQRVAQGPFLLTIFEPKPWLPLLGV